MHKFLMTPDRLVLVVVLLFGGSMQQANAQSSDVTLDPLFEKRGSALYSEHCASCHGAEGDGLGPQAEQFSPRPRDFTVGNYKFRTSDIGAYPARVDIIRGIDHGGPASSVDGIPSFEGLNAMDRHALSEKIRGFGAIPAYDIPITVPPRSATANA